MLVALDYVTAALFVLIVLGGVMWLAGFSLFKFLKYLREELPSRPRSHARRHRKAKVVATLGPASSDQDTIRALFEAGADVFRFNFSHDTHQDHQARYDIVRRAGQGTGRPIAVLADLPGPKLRIGTFADGPIKPAAGASFGLDLDDKPGDQNRAGMPYPENFQALKPGVELLLDDGKVRLVVESCAPTHAVTRVVVPGTLSNRKGVSVIGALLPLSG
jgi:pyruvate kinase